MESEKMVMKKRKREREENEEKASHKRWKTAYFVQLSSQFVHDLDRLFRLKQEKRKKRLPISNFILVMVTLLIFFF